MITTSSILFLVNMALLFTHELDAIYRHEWRMFGFLRSFKDETQYKIFILLHIPLFIIIFWFMGNPADEIRLGFQIVMDIFFIIHGIVHVLFKNHKGNEFKSFFSKGIIGFMAVLGFAHLLLIINI